jgi:3-deoxy-D-manno-octulosonate 8-phosphate phosphatase (KDO 8-P phosphatase)
MNTTQIRARAKKIKLLLLDVDGVLTDGRIFYLPNPHGGIFETKAFHSRDGLGIRFAHEAGLKTGILSGRSSPVVEYRAKELGFHFIQEAAIEKLEPFEKMLRAAGLKEEEVCYVGDDIVDLPVLKRVGLAVGVSGGHEGLRRHVHYWTRQSGGMGAVRETVELILEAQGKWKMILKRFLA